MTDRASRPNQRTEVKLPISPETKRLSEFGKVTVSCLELVMIQTEACLVDIISTGKTVIALING